MNSVWVFNCATSGFPAGVFSQRVIAEKWIRERGLSGTLTEYPVDVGVYDWAVSNGHFEPKRDDQRSAKFVAQFSSATQEHYHYVLGRMEGGD